MSRPKMSQTKTGEQRAELYADLIDHGTSLLCEYAVEPDVAEQIASSLADYLAEHWAGQVISFPKEFELHLTKRDDQIYDEFTGNNHAALAKKYKITTRAMYRIIGRAQKRYQAKVQPTLF